MPAGRPTDYTPELAIKAWEYIGNDKKKNYESHGHAIPSVVGMCRILNRGRSTIYGWAEEKEHEFSDILAACKELQEFTTINGTLKNELNSNIGKLILGKHGYHDRQEVTGADGGALEIDINETERAARINAILETARTRGAGSSDK